MTLSRQLSVTALFVFILGLIIGAGGLAFRRLVRQDRPENVALNSCRSSGSDEDIGDPAAEPARVAIENISFRKTSEQDTGTIRVYLRNLGNSAVSFDELLFDGFPIKVWGITKVDPAETNAAQDHHHTEGAEGNHGQTPENEDTRSETAPASQVRFAEQRVIWGKLAPSPVPPGGLAECVLKLRNSLPRPVRVKFVPENGEPIETTVRAAVPTFAVSGVTFSANLRRMFVYVEGTSDRPVHLDNVAVEGLVPGESWLSGELLEKGTKQLCVLTLDTPLDLGAFLTVRATSAEGEVIMERVRVLTGFPIGMEVGPGDPKLGMDEETHFVAELRYTAGLTDESPSVPELPDAGAHYIFACAMHRMGSDRGRCAWEILRRYKLCRELDPRHGCLIHLCRTMPEIGLPMFAETVDIIRTNTNIRGMFWRDSENLPPEKAVESLTRHAYISTRPRRLQTLADGTDLLRSRDHVVASPAEFRRRTFTLLGNGSKGLLYRFIADDPPGTEDILDEVQRINQEVRQVRDELSIADVVDWTTVQYTDNLTVYSLLAGDDAVLVFLIRHESPLRADRRLPAAQGAGDPGDKVFLTINLPEYLRPIALQEIDRESRSDLSFDWAESGAVRAAVTVPEAARAYRLKVERAIQ
jgi:hypothetical protein